MTTFADLGITTPEIKIRKSYSFSVKVFGFYFSLKFYITKFKK